MMLTHLMSRHKIKLNILMIIYFADMHIILINLNLVGYYKIIYINIRNSVGTKPAQKIIWTSIN